ncbi:MAG: bifunctional UDP-N-acetylglucosamine diphosphorylase/glucosamine-1-phosphate N-acetyltransferase GlmU, partial [Aquificota bacterium]|nr:bifunctional UDP-N-acetylglucosamine diphosphorylase/glucosamine-1-phosphate N-acetyltransferase GlmU [Aquificota bacterium]
DYLLVVNGDSPLIMAETVRNIQRFIYMVEEYENVRISGVVLTAQLSDPTGYGRVIKEKGTDRILRIVEEKEATPEERALSEVNAGLYVFFTPHLSEVAGELRPSEKTGEVYITDAVNLMASRGMEVRSFMATDPTEALGVNTRWDLSLAENVLRIRLIRYWSERGVTFHIPETVWIEPGVTLGEEVEIEPDVTLKGRTRVERGALIGRGSYVEDSDIGEDVRILPYSVVIGAKVERGAVVGPFAHLREGTTIGESSEIGAFVEVKRSSVGRRVKAKHLAYIGDAEVGDEANIGAGAVTANYDGRKKHRTVIGKRAFIGSNSLLVAPVEVGEESYVAGGSVITRNVPEGALAVERAEMKVFEGKGKKKLRG